MPHESAANVRSLQPVKLPIGVSDFGKLVRDGFTHVVYNPWSIANCLQKQGALRTYWANTSGSALLRKLMPQADTPFQEGMEQLMAGKPARATIDPNMAHTASAVSGKKKGGGKKRPVARARRVAVGRARRR